MSKGVKMKCLSFIRYPSTKATKQQSNKAPKHQSTKAPKQQSNKATKQQNNPKQNVYDYQR
jgi:hypothetical protein